MLVRRINRTEHVQFVLSKNSYFIFCLMTFNNLSIIVKKNVLFEYRLQFITNNRKCGAKNAFCQNKKKTELKKKEFFICIISMPAFGIMRATSYFELLIVTKKKLSNLEFEREKIKTNKT